MMAKDLEQVIGWLQSQPHLVSNIERDSEVAIYGAGNFGRAVFEVLQANSFRVICFFDQKARPGMHYRDVPIWRLEQAPFSAEQKARLSVVIAIHNPHSAIPPLERRLHQLGYVHVINPIALADEFGAQLGERYWLTARVNYQTKEADIRAAYALWADPPSRSLYLANLALRLTGDYSVLPAPDSTCQYFPSDLPGWGLPLRLVDCGAYDGDMLERAPAAGVPVQAIAAFEPDADNFDRLLQRISQARPRPSEVYLWPCGVYRSTSQQRFAAAQDAASAICPTGTRVVQCVALDEVIPYFAPTLIKMDIEGAELDALLGAKQLIGRYRPGLAICVYHAPDHLWQIPLLLDSWGLGYRCFLRSHAYNGFDQVMYAIPPD